MTLTYSNTLSTQILLLTASSRKMLRDKWPKLAFLIAVCSTTVSAIEELQNISPLQTLGLGLRDLVLRTFTLCGTEFPALRKDTSEASEVRNTLCTFLLKPHPETGRGHYGAPAYNTYV
jgi:hypothetical protein